MEISLLRIKEVQARTGLPPSSLYGLIQAGQFPAPVAITARTVGWRSDEVTAWIEARPRVDRGLARANFSKRGEQEAKQP